MITINGFKQDKLAELGLDCKDAVILDYIVEIWTTTGWYAWETPTKEQYALIDYQQVINNNPSLKIHNVEALKRRIDVIHKAGVLKKAKQGRGVFYAINIPVYNSLIDDTTSEVGKQKIKEN